MKFKLGRRGSGAARPNYPRHVRFDARFGRKPVSTSPRKMI